MRLNIWRGIVFLYLLALAALRIIKKALVPLAVIVLAVTCVAGAPPSKQPFVNEIETAKHALERTLKDPSSVQYRNVRVVSKKSGAKTICMEFNSKNSYGGYGGFQTLTAPLNDPTSLFIVETTSDSTQIQRCNTDEAEAADASTLVTQRNELRETRRKNIEASCVEKRQAIEDSGSPDAQARRDELERSCADLIRKSNAN